MTAIVRIALSRPYTVVVMAILILLFGGLSALRTPTDIFPNIGIPVISVVWSYTGLPPDDMAGRILSNYERALSTTVNDIEHIEAQSLPGVGIVKVFFQPGVNISAAQAQVTAISQTVLKQMPNGITPPIILVYNASSVPIIQLALSSDNLSQTQLNDLAQNFIRPQLTTVAGRKYLILTVAQLGSFKSISTSTRCTPTISRRRTSVMLWPRRTLSRRSEPRKSVPTNGQSTSTIHQK